jgi:hypothetical protein
VDLGAEDNWDTMGGPTERSRSPAPTLEEIVPQMAQQTPGAAERQASAEENGLEPSVTTGAEGPVATEPEQEAPAEAGLVDIASILGAPSVTVVWSNL